MPLDLNARIYDSLSNKALNKLQSAMYRAVDFIEAFLPDPDDYNKKIKLYRDQRDAIDTVQFGYPLSKFKFDEIQLEEQPAGGVLMSRRQVGKSILIGYTSAAMNIIGAGFDYKIPCFCGMMGASEDSSIELIEKTKDALEYSEFNDFIIGRPKQDRIKLANGSFTRAHPCSEKSIRGKKYHYLFVDEGAWAEEHVVFKAAFPTVEHGIRWFVITTPQGTKGRLAQMYIKAIGERPVICRNCLTHYDQKEFLDAEFPIKNEIWFMPKITCPNCQGTEFKYGYGYIATPWINPWECPIIDQKKLLRELDYYSWAPWVRQEKLGELVDEASMIFLKEWIDRATNVRLRNTMERREGIFYTLGLDFGRLHDATCFTLLHRDPISKRIVLDYMRSISGEFDFETDWSGIHEQAREIISFYQPSLVVMDSTGVGYREVEDIQKQMHEWSPGSVLYHSQKNWFKLPPEKRRLGFWFDRINKPQLIGNLKASFSTNPAILEIPPKTESEIDEFVNELLRFECKEHENGYIEYGTQDYHDDRLISYALALWGFIVDRKSPRGKPRAYEYNYLPKKTGLDPNYNYAKKKKIIRAKPQIFRMSKI